MLKVLILSMLLFYFWCFYFHNLKSIATPTVLGPDPPKSLSFKFSRPATNAFQIVINNISWQEIITHSSYFVAVDHIQEADVCRHRSDGSKLPAHGLNLYQFIKKYPKFEALLQYQTQHSEYKKEDASSRIIPHGTPFYFTCSNDTIDALSVCAPGHIFENDWCKPISSCTHQLDGVLLPSNHPKKYILCKNGREFLKQCPPKTFFFETRCVPEDERDVLCILHENLALQRVDDFTLFGCQNYKPVYKRCPPGTQLFGNNSTCEPNDCVHKPDGTHIPLRKRKRNAFEFVPGYSVCQQGKIIESVECSERWDAGNSNEENLTILPMVYHQNQCSVPSFCENVFPTDPNVIVPVYDFTKHVQNWENAKYFDQVIGYECEQGQKKKRRLDPGKRINAEYKVSNACDVKGRDFWPIPNQPQKYYDCIQQTIVTCPANQFFNGQVCQVRPERAFEYQGIPLFEFNELNPEGWIKPLTKKQPNPIVCESSNYKFVTPYNICSHPDCIPFAFLVMIPELSILLPRHQQAKCKFDERTKHLRKESVTFNYTFWNQKIIPDNLFLTDNCTFGQHLMTGNFIWDQTIFATCDDSLPFVFCPSVHTRNIEGSYACAPPPTDFLELQHTADYEDLEQNQFQHISPITSADTSVKLNPKDGWHILPPDGLHIPLDKRLKLYHNHPVRLQYWYRYTYPPHVVFRYDNGNRETKTAPDSFHAFSIWNLSFHNKQFKFPRYRTLTHVPNFTDIYDP